jgi:uncharacterized OB-fold protein
MTTTERPSRFDPPASPVAEPFWEATKERRLLVQWCLDCDKAVFYPREICPGCFGVNLEWREASGNGNPLHLHRQPPEPEPHRHRRAVRESPSWSWPRAPA